MELWMQPAAVDFLWRCLTSLLERGGELDHSRGNLGVQVKLLQASDQDVSWALQARECLGVCPG